MFFFPWEIQLKLLFYLSLIYFWDSLAACLTSFDWVQCGYSKLVLHIYLKLFN